MATGIIRSVVHRIKRIVVHNFAAGRAIQAHHENKRIETHKNYQNQLAKHKQSVKARVSGVRAAVKSATKGTRKQRADQLRGMRKNSAQRAQLRRRVKFKTQMP